MLRAMFVSCLLLQSAVVSAQAQAREPIRFGVETGFPPFVVTLPSGDLGGFDIDIVEAMCAELETECAFVSLAWEGIIPALIDGKIDAIPSLSINNERREVIDFSDKYYETSNMYVGPKDVEIDVSPEGLAGKAVGTQIATTSACYLERELSDIIDLRYYDNQESLLLDMTAGRIDLVFTDTLLLAVGFLTRPEAADFEVKGEPVFDPVCMGSIAFGVRKGDDDIRNLLNDGLKAIRASGEYQRISDQYFGLDIYGD